MRRLQLRVESGQSHLRPLTTAGRLSVLTDAAAPAMTPALLQFRYEQGQDTLHWFGLLTHQRLFLDSAAQLLEQAEPEGLAAILEFVEVKMEAIWVLVGVRKEQLERGRLLRAFSYVGFEVVRPEQRQWLPTCSDNIFLVYVMDRPQDKSLQ